MCLRGPDGNTFCSVLLAAPEYEGLSLERNEHNLEEGKRPYTDEIEELLAKTCGLSREEYRARITQIRGDNILRQLQFNHIFNKHGPSFVLFGCNSYINGEVHEIPIPHITDEARTALKERFASIRYGAFCARLDKGILITDLDAYPERDKWLPAAEQKLRTRKRNRFLGGYCHRVTVDNILPSSGIYYPNDQLDKLFLYFSSWFDERNWKEPPAIIRECLEAGEAQLLEELFGRCHDVYSRKYTKSQRRRNQHNKTLYSKNLLRIEFEALLRFKQLLKAKHLNKIKRMLFGENLLEKSPTSIAA